MLRFGLAGIPLSSKGRTLRDGIEDTYMMGLSAMEVQFLKVNVYEKDASEEIGLYPREVVPEKKELSKIIVNVIRADKNGNFNPIGINKKIEEEDILRILQWNLATSYEELRDLKALARELDIQLTIHTPYYMDLLGVNSGVEKSINYILWGSYLGNEMGCNMVVNNVGLYHKRSSKDAINTVLKRIKDIKELLKKEKLGIRLAFETSEKKEVFGSLDEILEISKKSKNVYPVVNFAKVYAREDYRLSEKEDFEVVLDKIEKYYNDYLYFQFAGLEYTPDYDLRLAPIKKGDLKFETMSDVLLDIEKNVTVISNSPLLEHDAQYMRIILERSIEKILQKKKR